MEAGETNGSKHSRTPPSRDRTNSHSPSLKPVLRINFGRGRQIRSDRPLFHESVRERMVAANLEYRPQARWDTDKEQYVD